MKNCLLLLTVIALYSFPSFAQDSKAAAEHGKCLLWRISGNGLSKPSYLFGAIDFICPDNYIWTKTMEDCFKKSDKVCLQMDVTDPELKTKAREAMTNTNGKTLKDYFSPLEYTLAENYAKQTLHVDLSKIQKFKPMVIQPSIIKQLLGCAGQISYQTKLGTAAKDNGKAIEGLETLNEEMEVIEETHFNEFIARVLVEMAGGSTRYATFRSNIEDAYQQHDLQRMHSLFRDTAPFSPAELNILLNKTNKRWMAGMPGKMQQGSVFFVLNALNLWGEEGMISLLKKAGYKVEPVTD